MKQGRVLRVVTMLLFLGICAALVSCGGGGTQGPPSEITPSGTASGYPDTVGDVMAISDANIAAIVLAANNADIDNGKQAQAKSKNADVKAFAKQMITDHTSVNDKAAALAKKLSLTPEEDETSRGLRSAQDSVRASLQGKSGAEFDKAYVDNEVSYHQTVLDAIDTVLIPKSQNAELKQLLTDTRPVVAAHLEHAKQIQTKFSGAAAK